MSATSTQTTPMLPNMTLPVAREYRKRIEKKQGEIKVLRHQLRQCKEKLREARTNPVTKSNVGGRRTRKKQKGGHHLYKRLGVSKYASQKQIRKAFKTLKKKRKATKNVKEAFKILSRKKTRKEYNNRYRKMKRKK